MTSYNRNLNGWWESLVGESLPAIVSNNKIFLDLPLEKLLTIVTQGEAGNQGDEGKLAVLNVIKNRTNSGEFSDKIIEKYSKNIWKSVILKPGQFSMFNLDDKVRPLALKWAKEFEDTLNSNSNFRRTYELVRNFIRGDYGDNTNGSVYYHTTSISPYWAKLYTPVKRIGEHIFYTDSKLVRYSPIAIIGLGVMIYYLWIRD